MVSTIANTIKPFFLQFFLDSINQSVTGYHYLLNADGDNFVIFVSLKAQLQMHFVRYISRRDNISYILIYKEHVWLKGPIKIHKIFICARVCYEMFSVYHNNVYRQEVYEWSSFAETFQVRSRIKRL